MLVSKCDICRRTIIEGKGIKVSFNYFNGFEFCSDCAKPVMKFLKAKKLVKKETKTAGKRIKAANLQ